MDRRYGQSSDYYIVNPGYFVNSGYIGTAKCIFVVIFRYHTLVCYDLGIRQHTRTHYDELVKMMMAK